MDLIDSNREYVPDYLGFLREAAEEINGSADYKATLKNVANTMVPNMSDWCALDIVDEEGIPRRLAVAHSDPEKIKLAQKLSDKYPTDPDAPSGTPKVIRTGEPEMANGISDDMLKAVAKDEEHLRLIRSVGFHSVLIYPIRFRGKTLGAVSLVWSEHKRNYSLSDIAFVEVLTVIAAGAIENARLASRISKAAPSPARR